jgi:hypothetical protein
MRSKPSVARGCRSADPGAAETPRGGLRVEKSYLGEKCEITASLPCCVVRICVVGICGVGLYGNDCPDQLVTSRKEHRDCPWCLCGRLQLVQSDLVAASQGVHVVAVQNPLTSFADDVAATRRVIALQDGSVLLVGHSYGGVVITEAGNDPKVVGLVYVAAFAPNESESINSVTKNYPPAPLGGELRPDARGFLSVTPKGIAEDIAQDLPAEEQPVLTATQGQTSSTVLVQPSRARRGRISDRGA